MKSEQHIPDGWAERRLGDFCTEVRRRDGGSGNLPVLSVSTIHGVMLQAEKFGRRVASADVSAYKRIRCGEFAYDPMLLWDASIGRLDCVEEGVVSPAYTVFAIDDSVDSEFVLALLRSHEATRRYQLISQGTNKRRRKAAYKDFAELSFAMPPVEEQRRVSAVLRAAGRAARASHRIVIHLRTVERSMLGDQLVGPRTGPGEGGPAPGRDATFPACDTVALGDVCQVGNGSTPSRSEPRYWVDGRIPWLPTRKVNDSFIVAADEFVTSDALRECPLPLVPAGSVLVAMIGQGKTRGMAAYLGIDACVNQNFAYVIPGPEVDAWFLYHVLSADYAGLRAGGRGSQQDALNCSILRAYPLPLPPLSEQKRIAETMAKLRARRAAEEGVDAALGRLERGLTAALLSGTVRLPEARRVTTAT